MPIRSEVNRFRAWAKRKRGGGGVPNSPVLPQGKGDSPVRPNGVVPGGGRQTSPQVSTKASRIVQLSYEEMLEAVNRDARGFFSDVKTIAASALSQDETRGQD